MAGHAIRTEERLPLVLAVLAHAALFAWLAIQRPAPPPPLPERMTVTLSDELGPISTSPEPLADPAPDVGPVLAETPAEPEPVVTPEPKPSPKPLAKQPAPQTPPKAPPKAPPKQPAKKGGATAFDSAFSSGTPGAAGKQPAKAPPAAAPSAQLVGSWSSSIGAKVRGPWNACAVSGLDAEQLVVTVRFTLDRFGEVSAMEEPVVAGITEGNRPQVNRFKECAVRAIRAAAPFDNLPREFYDYWKSRKLNFRKQ
jgi:outer membrane biosynthesis protein TonB